MDPAHQSPKVKLGLIGFGRLGSIHAHNIFSSPHAELYAVCDPDPAARNRAQALYPNTLTVANLQELLTLPIDAVVIASNTNLHLEHIRLAANAGKHIFTEKPIGLTLEETDTVMQCVVDAGVKFQIGFQRRWDPRFLKAKQLIESGEIGRPVLLKAYGRDPDASNQANWGLDKNGGLFVNAAIHDYDTARFLLNGDVVKLSATGAALVHTGLAKVKDIDTCSTVLFLDNDTMAMTEWSRYATYGYDIGAEVIGTDGMIQIGREHNAPIFVRRKNKDAPTIIDEFMGAYSTEISEFAKAILLDTPTTPGIEDARLALHIALLARQSFEQQIPKVVPALNVLKRR